MPRRSPRRSLRTSPKASSSSDVGPVVIAENPDPIRDDANSDPDPDPDPSRVNRNSRSRRAKSGRNKVKKVSKRKAEAGVGEESAPGKSRMKKAKSSEPAADQPAMAQKKSNSNGKAKVKVDPLAKWCAEGKILREETVRKSAENSGAAGHGRQLSIYSVNVAGLRAMLNNPKRLQGFKKTVEAMLPDVLCIQEHKLQEHHVEEVLEALQDCLPGYSGLITCSGPPAKKGYSGVASFIRVNYSDDNEGDEGGGSHSSSGSDASETEVELGLEKSAVVPKVLESNGALSVLSVEHGLGEEHATDSIASSEGRVLTVEFPLFYLMNVYTPNSGQKLDRLGYRTGTWDKIFLDYVKSLEKSKPVVIAGDLNCAHQVIDMHNFYTRPAFPDFEDHYAEDIYVGKAKGLLKQAGCTVKERKSFTEILDAGLVDTFRHFHPTSKGCFSYWSIRAGNRSTNKGLRLDYCLVSRQLCEDEENKNSKHPKVVEAFICDDLAKFPAFSDHCLVGITLQVKAS